LTLRRISDLPFWLSLRFENKRGFTCTLFGDEKFALRQVSRRVEAEALSTDSNAGSRAAGELRGQRSTTSGARASASRENAVAASGLRSQDAVRGGGERGGGGGGGIFVPF